MTMSLRNILLATVASVTLVACGGGTTSSPGNVGPVTVNVGGGTPTTPTVNTIDLVPGGACPAGSAITTISNSDGNVQACSITGTITENTTLDPNIGYALNGPVFVGTDNGQSVSLTIPAGTQVFGESGTDYLVVARGSRIVANGTSTDPVIFTSVQDIQGQATETDRGQWGGLVINGNAPINACTDATAAGGSAGCVKSGEGSSGLFGGDNPNDNSGTLSFVQVKYAGNLINNEDELNGIAFQGVGNGTTCNNIQVHNNADDGVEFFGGTVECSFVVLTGNGDDSLDWTDGWTGGAQFVVIDQADDAGDRGIEADNRSNNTELLPRSNPTVANFTFLGGEAADSGVVLRAGTDAVLCNGVVTGFPDAGFDIDGDSSLARAASGNIVVQSTLLDNADNVESGDDNETFDTEAFFNGGANNTQTTNSLSDLYFPGQAEAGVTPCNLQTIQSAGSTFSAPSYIGAFSPTETPESSWASGWTFGLFESPTECPAGTLSTGETLSTSNQATNGRQVCEIAGTVTSDLRLNNNFVYQLDGPVFIGEDLGGDPAAPTAGQASAILTIDAGTTIFGRSGQDYLIVARGSQIRSNGTRANPVIMTAREDVLGTVNAVSDRGLWGGLIINGRAPINACTDATAAGGSAGCVKSGEGSSGLFGGNAADDDSGNLFFTRVNFAGNLINNEDELNGIAFQGVGAGTEVDFIQVHNNADDGVEFFGGTVNVKHVYLTGNGDDSFDWTDGWTGNAQFVIVDQASDAGDRAIEGDNRSSNNELLPRSNPTISNLTFVGGAAADSGMVLRAGTAGRFLNGIIVDFPDAGVDVDGASSGAQLNAGNLLFDSMLVVDNNENLETDEATPGTVDAEDQALATAFANGSNNVTTGSSSVTDEQFVPQAGDATTPALDPSTLDPFFDSVNYIGAVEDAQDNWFTGWTLQVDQ